MQQNINTNINNYSNNELINLLKLSEDYSKQELADSIDYLITNHFNDNEKIKNFFLNAESRLLEKFNKYYNDNILPNYGNYIETMENMSNNESDTSNESYQDYKENNSDESNYINEENNSDESDYINEDYESSENQETLKILETMETMENMGSALSEQNKKETETTQQDSYNTFDLIKKNKEHIEDYNIYNYLHFNTLFRNKNNPLLETLIPATNSNFVLSSPINNISRIKLASINIKKPYLISSTKFNNTFIIKKFVLKNNINVCDFSNTIVIEDGYYDDKKVLETYLNNNYFYNSSNSNDFMKNIYFSINETSNKIKFELSNNYLTNYETNNTPYAYFSIDFKTNYTQYYSLATILGFDYNKSSSYYSSIDDICNNKIISKYTFSNKGNGELFFCLDEFQSNIIETHKLFLNNNMSTQKILAKINCSLGNAKTNYYINEVYSVTDVRNDHSREYDGVINLMNFNIKIIDYYGNIVNTNINEDFTFTLEIKINNSRLLKNNYNF